MHQALTDQQIHLLQLIASGVLRANHHRSATYYADLELLWELKLIEPVDSEFVLSAACVEFLKRLDGLP